MLYSFELEGEDHTHFIHDVDASTRDEAYEKLELSYPCARVISVHTEKQIKELEAARYESIARMYEEGWDYE